MTFNSGVNEWRSDKLNNITTKIGSGATPRGGKGAYKESGIPFIRSQNIYNCKFSLDGLVYIDEEQASKLKNVELQKNDILVNITGDSVARCTEVPEEFIGGRVNQHVSIIRADNKNLFSGYLKYYLVNHEMQIYLLNLASAGGTRPALTKGMLEGLEIKLPSLIEQKAIAKILSDLDEKIETNNEINKNLEEMAQAIFKQWFVDFEFPDKEGKAYKSSGGEMLESKLGMIPKGWSIQDLNNIVDVKDGTHDSPKPKKEGYRLITSKHIKGNKILYDEANLISKEDYEKVNLRSKVDKNDILITMIGTVGNLIIVDKENIDFAIKNIGLIKSSQKEDFYEYLYLYLKSKKMTNHIISRLVGSTQKYISLKELRVIPVIVPSEDMKILFKKTIESIFIEIRIKLLENERLEKIRDTILPKLMSGEVRVSLK